MTTQPQGQWGTYTKSQKHYQPVKHILANIHSQITLLVLVRKNLKIFIDQKKESKTELSMEHTKLADRAALISSFCF